MLLRARSRHRDPRSVLRVPDDVARVHVLDPITARVRTRATRGYVARSRPRSTCARPASPTPRTSGPRPSSTSSTTSRSTSRPTRGVLRGRLRRRASGPPGQGFQRSGEGVARPRLHQPLAGGLLPAPPLDTLSDLRGRMVLALERSASGPRSTTTRSAARARPRSTCASSRCCEMADALQLLQVRRRATSPAQGGKVATFLPKPIFEENGSGMHVHQSLWKNGETLMHAADGYALLSTARALHYVGRPARPRAGAARVLRARPRTPTRLVPGLRGPGACSSTRSATARPPCGSPMYFAVTQGQARGVPLPRSARQPLPRLPCAADGRARRDRARPGAAGSGGREPL